VSGFPENLIDGGETWRAVTGENIELSSQETRECSFVSKISTKPSETPLLVCRVN
jgi:hypothetical protein